jgi:uncharacterized membrane protein
MKKLFTLNAIFIVLCLLLSSCSSNISIVKRHYTKGYYIEYAKLAQTVPQNKPERTYERKAMVSTHTIPGLSKELYVKTDFNEDIKVPDIIPVEKQRKNKAITHVTTKLPITQQLTTTNEPVLQSQRTALSQASDYGEGHSERAALSLLWIIILILLILWLVGLLAGGFGLGGLINVLLVIALVLLILWLLRII